MKKKITQRKEPLRDIKDEMGSFWEVDNFKDDFSEEEKTLKNSGF